jgi:hypothetical protein
MLAIIRNLFVLPFQCFISPYIGSWAQAATLAKIHGFGYILTILFGLLTAGLTTVVQASPSLDQFTFDGFSQKTQVLTDLMQRDPVGIQSLQGTMTTDGFRETVIGESGLQYSLEFNSQSNSPSQWGSMGSLSSVEDGIVWVTLYSTISRFGAEPDSKQLNIELNGSDKASLFFQPDEDDPELLHIWFILNAVKEYVSLKGVGDTTSQQYVATLNKNDNMILDIVIDSEKTFQPATYQVVINAVADSNFSRITNNITNASDALIYRAHPSLIVYPNTPEYFDGVFDAIEIANSGFGLVSGAIFSDPVLEIPISVFSSSPSISINYVAETDSAGSPGGDLGFDLNLNANFELTRPDEEIVFSTTETTFEEKPAPLEAFPATNRDIDALIQAANGLKGLGAICDKYECPELDCDAAQELLQSLFDAKVYLRFMHFHLRQANDLYLKHWTNLMEQYGNTGTSQYNTLYALAWQQVLHSFGAAMLDIASFYEFVQDFVKDVADGTLSDDMSPLELLDKIDDALEALKDLEDGINNVTSKLNKGNGTGTAINDFEENLTGSFAHTQKSTLTNIKTVIKEAVEHGKDWKAALNKGKATAALGQIAGRYLEIYSKSLIEERIQHYEQLVRDASAEEKAIAEAYLQLQRVQTRRFRVEDAQKVLNEVMATIQPCIKKICGNTELNYRAVFEVKDQRFNQPHPLNPNIINFQPALVFANGKIVEITASLSKTLEVEEGCTEEGEVTFIFESIDDNFSGEGGAMVLESPVDNSFNNNGPLVLEKPQGIDITPENRLTPSSI